MLIGRDLSSQRSLKVLVLSTQSVKHVSSFTAIPLDHTVVQSLDEIALNDAGDEEDEDPLAEEPSFDQDDPLEPTLMDLVEHQDLDDAALLGRLHKALSHPNDRFLGVMLDHGALADVDYTSKDLRNHREIAGPCKACLMGRAKHLPTPDVSSPLQS